MVDCDEHNLVRQHFGVLEETDEAGKVLVRMIEHCGIRSLEAREDALFIRAVVLPSLYAGIARRQARRRRHDTHRLLSGDPAFALSVPAVLENLVVALDQVEGRLMRRMARAEREPQQPRRVELLSDGVR